MEDNIIEVKFQEPTRREKAKRWVKEKYDKTKQWCTDHKEMIMIFGPVAVSGAFELLKCGMKYKDKQADRDLEEKKLCSVYDRSVGGYVSVKRPLTSADWVKIQALKRQGMTTTEALLELGLLDI